MDWISAFLLLVVVVVGWGLTVFSLPGNWLMVAGAALYAGVGPGVDSRLAVGWWFVGALLVLAMLGELFEFLASSLGAAKAGASKRSAVLALLGSLVGSLVGAFFGLPIPLVGSMIAAIFGAALGASLGAIGGELWKGKELHETWTIGTAAFVGRLCGTVGKIAIGSAMAGATLVAMMIA